MLDQIIQQLEKVNFMVVGLKNYIMELKYVVISVPTVLEIWQVCGKQSYNTLRSLNMRSGILKQKKGCSLRRVYFFFLKEELLS